MKEAVTKAIYEAITSEVDLTAEQWAEVFAGIFIDNLPEPYPVGRGAGYLRATQLTWRTGYNKCLEEIRKEWDERPEMVADPTPVVARAATPGPKRGKRRKVQPSDQPVSE